MTLPLIVGFFCADEDCDAEPYDGPVQFIRLPGSPAMTFDREDIREALRLRLSTFRETEESRPIADWIHDLVILAQQDMRERAATLIERRHRDMPHLAPRYEDAAAIRALEVG